MYFFLHSAVQNFILSFMLHILINLDSTGAIWTFNIWFSNGSVLFQIVHVVFWPLTLFYHAFLCNVVYQQGDYQPHVNLESEPPDTSNWTIL